MRELMKSTNKEDIHQFIESVRGIPALWDHNNEEYKSTERRKALWEELANLYSFSDGTACYQKFKNLRDTYNRLVKAGRSPTGKNKSGWVFMEAMAFFKEGGGSNQDQLVSSVSNGRRLVSHGRSSGSQHHQLSPRHQQRKRPIPITNSSYNNVAEEDDEASYYHSHNQKPLLRHGSGDGRVELMMEGGGNMATNNDSSLSASFYNTRATTAVEEDTAECDAFGRLVANKMLKLSSPEKDEAQTRVLQVFAEIKSRRHYNNDFGNHNHDHE